MALRSAQPVLTGQAEEAACTLDCCLLSVSSSSGDSESEQPRWHLARRSYRSPLSCQEQTEGKFRGFHFSTSLLSRHTCWQGTKCTKQ